MAHDPTRHWPLGVGPENTSIPGAAWLELLDGQAFPVVGAGVMIWNGTMWVPVSTQNRLPVDAAVSGDVTLPVSDKGGKYGWHNVRLGNVAPNTELFLEDRTQPTIIDVIEFLTNNPHHVRLRVYSTASSGTTENVSRTVANDGTTLIGWNAETLRNYRPDFHVLEYNEVDNVYRFIRIEPWMFPSGCKIGVQNTDPSNEWMGALVVWGRDL